MRKSLKFSAYAVAGLILLTGLLTLLAVGLVNTERARRMVLERVNATLNGSLSLEHHHLALIGGQLELRQAQLHSAQGEPLIRLDRLLVEWRWRDLLGKTLYLSEVVLDGPSLDLVIGEDGRLNLMDVFPAGTAEKPQDRQPDKGGGELPINLVIADLRLRGGRLDFQHRPAGLHFQLARLEADADADIKGQKGRLDLKLADLKIQTPQLATHITPFELSAALKGDHLVLERLNLSTEKQRTHLEAKGGVEGFHDQARLDLKLALKSELSQWAALLPPDRPLNGPLQADLRVSGSLFDPTARLTATYGGGRLAGVAVSGADLDLTLDGRRLTLAGLNLRPADGEIGIKAEADLRPVWPQGFRHPSTGLDRLVYQLDLSARQLPLDLLPQLPKGYGGRLGAALHLSGRGVAPHEAPSGGGPEKDAAHADLEGRLSLSEARSPHTGTPATMTLTTEARLSGGRVDVAHLDLAAPEASLKAQGRVDLATAAVSAEARLKADDLSRLTRLAGLEHLAGQVAGQFDVAGRLDRPEVHFDLDGRSLAAQQITIGDLALAGDLNAQGVLTLGRLNLVNQGSRIDARGRLQLPQKTDASSETLPIEATVDLQTVEAADFVSADLAKGQLDGRIVIGGNLNHPRAEVALTGQALAVKNVTVGDLTVDAGIAKGVARIRRLGLQNGVSRLNVSGEATLYDAATLSPLADPLLHLDVKAPVIEIGDFYDQAEGRLSLTGQLRGRLSALTAEGHIAGHDLEAAGQAFSQMAVELSFAEQRLSVDTFMLSLAEHTPAEGSGKAPAEGGGEAPADGEAPAKGSGEARISGNGWVDTAGRYSISLSSATIPLTHIAAIAKQQTVGGTIAFDISGSGRLEDPGLKGEIRFSDMVLNQKPIDDGRLLVTVSEGAVRLAGGLDFDLTGSYTLASKQFEIDLTFDGTDLHPYLLAAGREDMAGRLDGRIRVRGNGADLTQTTAQVDVQHLALTYLDRPLLATDSLKAVFDNEVLDLQPTRLRLLDTGALEASGRLGLKGAVDFRVDGRVPLSVARPFMPPDSDLEGRADLHLSLGGSLNTPAIEARLDLAQVAMTVPVTLQKLQRLGGQIRYDGRRIEIQDLTGQLDDGRFAVSGHADVEGRRLMQADLAVDVQALPVVIPETADLKFDSHLRLTGDPKAARLQGEVTLLEGLYYKDVKLNLLEAATTRRRAQSPPAAEEPDPLLQAVELDVQVGYRSPFLVENNLAFLEVVPDLHLTGSLARPVIAGRAEVTEGELIYQRRRFEVTRGVVDFVDPYQLAAEVDVEGETQVRDWQITLAVSGSPDALRFKLSSDPPEEDNDILSLLLLGRTSREFIEGEGGTSQSPKQMVASLVASTMGEDIKRVTGVDILEVDTQNDEENPESERIQVTVGKKLSRRMTVKYAVESKQGAFTRRVISEYKFIDELLMTGAQDSTGIFSGELVFRLEFR
jgi:translocation and assembly module TamB